jgi:hypothetical protein
MITVLTRLDQLNEILDLYGIKAKVALNNNCQLVLTTDHYYWHKKPLLVDCYGMYKAGQFHNLRKLYLGGTDAGHLEQIIRAWLGMPHRPLSRMTYLHQSIKDVIAKYGIDEPVTGKCILCHQALGDWVDWWDSGSFDGPCCGYKVGCHQIYLAWQLERFEEKVAIAG